MAWATTDDLITLFPSLVNEPTDRLELVLASVEGFIMARLDESGVDYSNPQGSLATNLRTVTMWVSGRALESGGPMFGATSWSQTAGPVSQSATVDAGIGNLYLTAAELAMLGISGQGRGTQVFYSNDVLGGGDDA